MSPTISVKPHDRSGEILAGGILAGLIAGLIMELYMMVVMAAAQGMPIWQPSRGIAAVFFGQAAAGQGLWPVLFGLMIHFLTAAVWGVVFAVLIGHVTAGGAVGWGLVYGFLVYLVMFYVVLPILNAPMTAMRGNLGVIAEHLLYGAVLGVYAPLRDSIGGHRRIARALSS